MTDKKKEFWNGSAPESCDVCGKDFKEVFIDGKTAGGPWGLMCRDCHHALGIGLGVGRGQKYDLKTREKLEG